MIVKNTFFIKRRLTKKYFQSLNLTKGSLLGLSEIVIKYNHKTNKLKKMK